VEWPSARKAGKPPSGKSPSGKPLKLLPDHEPRPLQFRLPPLPLARDQSDGGGGGAKRGRTATTADETARIDLPAKLLPGLGGAYQNAIMFKPALDKDCSPVMAARSGWQGRDGRVSATSSWSMLRRRGARSRTLEGMSVKRRCARGRGACADRTGPMDGVERGYSSRQVEGQARAPASRTQGCFGGPPSRYTSAPPALFLLFFFFSPHEIVIVITLAAAALLEGAVSPGGDGDERIGH